MTGRAAGFYAGYPVPGYVNPVPGGGFWGWGCGRGRGGGRGWRNWFHATGLFGWQRAAMGYPAFAAPPSNAAAYAVPFAPSVTKEQEIDALKGQAEHFEDALEGIRKRIEELESKTKQA
ncbi:MAG: DUF5320 domain-containing protein [bacterium]|nr:DUF5320 domain-containing protein [bacterium]